MLNLNAQTPGPFPTLNINLVSTKICSPEIVVQFIICGAVFVVRTFCPAWQLTATVWAQTFNILTTRSWFFAFSSTPLAALLWTFFPSFPLCCKTMSRPGLPDSCYTTKVWQGHHSACSFLNFDFFAILNEIWSVAHVYLSACVHNLWCFWSTAFIVNSFPPIYLMI